MNRILGPGRWASRRLTPHRAVLLALLLLAAAAFVVSALDADFGYEPSDLLTWIVVAVVVSGAVTYLCAFIIRVPPNSDSWLITGLILFFVLPGGSAETAVATVALGSAAAAVSKYVLVWRRRLIINPAVAGAITCYAVAYAGADDVSYPFWWVAAKPLLIPMIVIGAVLVTVLREWPLIVGYFVGALGAIGYVQLDQGGQDLELWLTSSPMIFLAAIMLPEPLTSPATRVARVVYGVLVGAVLHCQQLVEITDSYTLEFTPEIALGIGCVFAFVVRLATRSARRVPLTDIRVDPLAENIFGVQGSVSSGAPPSYAPASGPVSAYRDGTGRCGRVRVGCSRSCRHPEPRPSSSASPWPDRRRLSSRTSSTELPREPSSTIAVADSCYAIGCSHGRPLFWSPAESGSRRLSPCFGPALIRVLISRI